MGTWVGAAEEQDAGETKVVYEVNCLDQVQDVFNVPSAMREYNRPNRYMSLNGFVFRDNFQGWTIKSVVFCFIEKLLVRVLQIYLYANYWEPTLNTYIINV